MSDVRRQVVEGAPELLAVVEADGDKRGRRWPAR